MTYIPNGNEEVYITVGSTVGYEGNQTSIANSSPWMFLKFTGCTASTTIGFVRIFCTVSFEPTADQKGIFEV